MANFFDQFDTAPSQPAQSQNFFDKFDAPQSQAQPAINPETGARRIYINGQPTTAQQQPTSGLGDTLADVGKSIVSKGAEGLIGLAGMPGDLVELGARGLDRATRGIGSLMGLEIAPRPDQEAALGSGQIKHAIEGVTGQFYEPHTTTGKYFGSVAEMLPAMIGGPESLATKFATRALVPGLASEGAGQATKGTAIEPFARVGGALIGGMGAAKALAPSALAAPTAGEIKGASKLAYKHPEVRALEINPASTSQAADNIAAHLNAEGFRDITAPATYRLVQELKNPVLSQSRLPMVASPVAKIEDVTAVKTALSKLTSTPGAEGAAAKTAISKIDGYLANLKQPDLIAGNAQKATQILKQASSDWRSQSQLNAVNEALAKAQRQASRSHSGTNIDNATRQKFSSILDNPKKSKFFTTEEKEQMQKIVDGTFVGNLSRKVAKLFPQTGLGGMATGALALKTGGLALGLPAAGYVARKFSDASTAKRVAELQRMIAMNSSVGRSLPLALPSTNPAIGGLLSGLTEARNRRLTAPN